MDPTGNPMILSRGYFWWWVRVNQKSIRSNRLIYIHASGNAQVPPLEGDGCSLTVSCSRLWVCCIILHHMQCCGARPQEWVWGALWGLWWVMTPLSCLPCECPIYVALLGLEFHSWAGLCKGGMDVQCLWPEVTLHIQNLPLPPTSFLGGVFINLASPTPDLAREGFSAVWLSCGCILLPQPCLFLPRPEMIEQLHPLYLIWVASLTVRNSSWASSRSGFCYNEQNSFIKMFEAWTISVSENCLFFFVVVKKTGIQIGLPKMMGRNHDSVIWRNFAFIKRMT